MNNPVHIIATGARTPLGLQAAPAAAAVRAGISKLGEHPFMIDQSGEPMPGAIDTQLDPALWGPKQLLSLAKTALREACAPLIERAISPLLKIPVYIGLPELRPGFTKQDAEEVREGVTSLDELPIDIAEVKVSTEGHAAGLLALVSASEQIGRGGLEACLVGGIDSYFHPDTMEWLDENRQLAGAVSRSGFVPGEGAGFCLIMSEKGRKRLGLETLARIRSAARGKETKLIKTSDICLGEGLTETIRNAVDNLSLPDETISDIICDINGERYRGEEWGFVCLRLPEYFDNPTAYLAPSEYWGDVGAASGPLFVMLACQAASRGYAKGPFMLLWTSSEKGLRAAAVLDFENVVKNVGRNRGHV